MASILQHRRGGYSIRANMTPAVGELFQDTDVGRLFFGDGATFGGFLADAPDIVGVSAGSYNANGVDVGRMLVFTGTGTAVALSQAGAADSGLIDNHTGFHVLNLSSGNVVITPTTSAINNNPTLTVPPSNFASIWSDGTDYYAFVGASTTAAGSVTSVATGSGLTGGPVTTTGTISLATIADNRLLANVSGGVGVPSATTLSTTIDEMIGGINGDTLERVAGFWTNIPATHGTVISVATGTGLTGGPITGSGTVSLDTVADNRLLANISGGAAAPSAQTLSDVIDEMIGGSNGDILIRVLGTWTNQRPKYTIASASSGLMTASQNLLFHRVSKGITFPANFGSYLGSDSQAGGSANATGSTVITVSKATNASPLSFSTIGTITIAASSVTPTFATSGGTTQALAQGDVLRLQGPGSPDGTLTDFYATLVALET